MEVTTSAPILIDGKNNTEDFHYYNANRRARNRSRRRRGEGFMQNVQRFLKNPFVQNLAAAKLGIKPVEESGGSDSPSPELPPTPLSEGKESKGMSTGVKIAIGVVVLALVGGAVYFVIKKKKAKAKTT